MREAVFAFTRIQLHLRCFLQLHQLNVRSDYSCAKIFSAGLIISLALNDNIFYQTLLLTLFRMCKPGKNHMFSAEAKTKV